MSSTQQGPIVTRIASGAVEQYDCIIATGGSGQGKKSTGVASEDNTFIGVALEAAASGSPFAMQCAIPGTTVKCRATSAVTAGTKVYTMADGEVDDVTTSVTCVGIAEEASGSANDIIEVTIIAGGNDDIS